MFSQRQMLVVVACALAILCVWGEVAGALTFNFTPTRGMSQQAIGAFQQAGALWSSVLSDPVAVNIKINFTSLGSGILGSTSVTGYSTSYTNFDAALTNDATSAADATALASLPTGASFNMLINRTSNNPYGAGSATPYVDSNGNANNTTIYTASADAKALGLLAANRSTSDGSISLSKRYTWDFTPSNGITAGQFDFVGIAAHEIGHVLGFDSGVDVLDYNSSKKYYADSAFTYVSPLDLFRYSALSASLGVIDWTADKRDKYFSIDGGATNLGGFSTGSVWGDKYQASHWKDNLGLGIMDPTSAPGEKLGITALDLEGMDVIGWNLSSSGPAGANYSLNLSGEDGFGVIALRDEAAVPEPGTVLMIGMAAFGFAGVAWWRRRRI